ncbi:hypothetical protein GCM10022214_34320 [Actinomadura miaoliensis]|uniref:Uncharacterized protein n=1 Tax=Actinomadura miaoliensis TaxID=430685 RepID=A0ABP7VU54_9ACTN
MNPDSPSTAKPAASTPAHRRPTDHPERPIKPPPTEAPHPPNRNPAAFGSQERRASPPVEMPFVRALPFRRPALRDN